MLEVNLSEVVAEVTALFQRYEKALVENDVQALSGFFWDSPHTVRYGVAENLYGADQIRAFRSASGKPPVRLLSNTRITTFGRDHAVANTEFRRDTGTACGRQSQTWVRMSEGWRIVSAHVSIVELK
jgi:hypothetical protein